MSTVSTVLRRNPYRFNIPVSDYSSLDEFLAVSSINPGMNVVRHGPHFVDMQYIEEDSDTLLVMFNGAITVEARKNLPNFEFYNLTESVKASKLFIADPALAVHEAIATGWYTGASDLPLQVMLPRIIEKFAQQESCNAEINGAHKKNRKKIVLFGNSAGGFGAMFAASQLPGSLVIASAPQTNLVVHTKEAIELFSKHCFGIESPEAVHKLLEDSICSNLIPLFAKETRPKLIYLQNRSDWHINYHLKPLLAGLGLTYTGENIIESDLAVILGEWGNGHVFPPVPFIQWLLNTACNYSGLDFDEFINPSLVSSISARA